MGGTCAGFRAYIVDVKQPLPISPNPAETFSRSKNRKGIYFQYAVPVTIVYLLVNIPRAYVKQQQSHLLKSLNVYLIYIGILENPEKPGDPVSDVGYLRSGGHLFAMRTAVGRTGKSNSRNNYSLHPVQLR